jgi:hypothetical protein
MHTIYFIVILNSLTYSHKNPIQTINEAQLFLAFIVLIITDRLFLVEECQTVMFLSFRSCLFPCVSSRFIVRCFAAAVHGTKCSLLCDGN